MNAYIPAVLAAFVRERANEMCEYCRLPQRWQEARFHEDHVHPRKLGGPTIASNLALACVTCSLRKAARTHAIDPETLQLAPLFHPRRDVWEDHFQWSPKWRLHGKTASGRATIAALGMNRRDLVLIRRRLAKLGEFPA